MTVRPSSPWLLCLIVLALPGCMEKPGVPCGAGVCAAGKACDELHRGCVEPEQLSECAERAEFSDCSYPGEPVGSCIDGVCLPEGCGNGYVEPDEVCDDGNNDNNDGCTADCRSDETCGNGIVDSAAGESCDDGKHCQDGTACNDDSACALVGDARCRTRNNDACHVDCGAPTCGDGVIDEQANEQCDCGTDSTALPDGCSAINGDLADAECRSNCQPRHCGDGVTDVAAGESCDDGNFLPGDGCSGACQPEVCGNGILDVVQVDGALLPVEGCDDLENGLSHDGCANLCVLETPRWTEMRTPVAGAPPERDFHALVYDAGMGRVVLFGGDAGGAGAGDRRGTWGWDGSQWHETRLPSGSVAPPGREGYAMAYDAARRRVVLFGGEGEGARQLLRDTWEWDGYRWTRLQPPSEPTQRRDHAMAYDRVRKRVVLFGGRGCDPARRDCDDGENHMPQDLDDTWEWDGARWTPVSPAAPARSPVARNNHAMAFDSVRGEVVLFGGRAGTSFSDTWSWDGSTWSDTTPADPEDSPPASDSHAMAYDLARESVIAVNTAGTWSWSGAAWVQVAAGSPGCGTRGGCAMAYDLARRRIVVHDDRSRTFDEDGGTWFDVTPDEFDPPEPVPVARSGHAMAYDGARAGFVLFGGRDNAGADLGDTWSWNGIGWKALSPAKAPAPRHRHSLVYDSIRRRIMLFGGEVGLSDSAETWQWDGLTWALDSSGAGPAAQSGHAMAYDSSRERVVLFGPASNRTWEYDGDSWNPVNTSDYPAEREHHAMAYDAARKRVVLFGGAAQLTPFGPAVDQNDTWEYDGVNWSRVAPLLSPPARESHSLTYDAARQRVILVGGENCESQICGPVDDVWEWDGTTWREISPQLSPPIRNRHAMGYDSARARLVFFGGVQVTYLDPGTSSTYFQDIWSLRYSADRGETCTNGAGLAGIDLDADGLVGCEDPDCWAFCTPQCPPGSTTLWPRDCDSGVPRCGDGSCDALLESSATCPVDCGPPAICGDYLCDSTETVATCPGDC